MKRKAKVLNYPKLIGQKRVVLIHRKESQKLII